MKSKESTLARLKVAALRQFYQIRKYFYNISDIGAYYYEFATGRELL
jgi:hypothetical protein